MTQEIIAQAKDVLDNPLDYPGLPERQDATIKFRMQIDYSDRAIWSWTVYRAEGTFYVRRIVWEPTLRPYDSPNVYGSESTVVASQIAELTNQLASMGFSVSALQSGGGIDGVTYSIEVCEGETTTRGSWWCEPPSEFQALGDWLIRALATLDALLPRSTVWPFDEIGKLTECVIGSAKSDIERTAEGFFAKRKGHSDKDAAIRFLTRDGGEVPRDGDEMPD